MSRSSPGTGEESGHLRQGDGLDIDAACDALLAARTPPKVVPNGGMTTFIGTPIRMTPHRKNAFVPDVPDVVPIADVRTPQRPNSGKKNDASPTAWKADCGQDPQTLATFFAMRTASLYDGLFAFDDNPSSSSQLLTTPRIGGPVPPDVPGNVWESQMAQRYGMPALYMDYDPASGVLKLDREAEANSRIDLPRVDLVSKGEGKRKYALRLDFGPRAVSVPIPYLFYIRVPEHFRGEMFARSRKKKSNAAFVTMTKEKLTPEDLDNGEFAFVLPLWTAPIRRSGADGEPCHANMKLIVGETTCDILMEMIGISPKYTVTVDASANTSDAVDVVSKEDSSQVCFKPGCTYAKQMLTLTNRSSDGVPLFMAIDLEDDASGAFSFSPRGMDSMDDCSMHSPGSASTDKSASRTREILVRLNAGGSYSFIVTLDIRDSDEPPDCESPVSTTPGRHTSFKAHQYIRGHATVMYPSISMKPGKHAERLDHFQHIISIERAPEWSVGNGEDLLFDSPSRVKQVPTVNHQHHHNPTQTSKELFLDITSDPNASTEQSLGHGRSVSPVRAKSPATEHFGVVMSDKSGLQTPSEFQAASPGQLSEDAEYSRRFQEDHGPMQCYNEAAFCEEGNGQADEEISGAFDLGENGLLLRGGSEMGPREDASCTLSLDQWDEPGIGSSAGLDPQESYPDPLDMDQKRDVLEANQLPVAWGNQSNGALVNTELAVTELNEAEYVSYVGRGAGDDGEGCGIRPRDDEILRSKDLDAHGHAGNSLEDHDLSSQGLGICEDVPPHSPLFKEDMDDCDLRGELNLEEIEDEHLEDDLHLANRILREIPTPGRVEGFSDATRKLHGDYSSQIQPLSVGVTHPTAGHASVHGASSERDSPSACQKEVGYARESVSSGADSPETWHTAPRGSITESPGAVSSQERHVPTTGVLACRSPENVDEKRPSYSKQLPNGRARTDAAAGENVDPSYAEDSGDIVHGTLRQKSVHVIRNSGPETMGSSRSSAPQSSTPGQESNAAQRTASTNQSTSRPPVGKALPAEVETFGLEPIASERLQISTLNDSQHLADREVSDACSTKEPGSDDSRGFAVCTSSMPVREERRSEGYSDLQEVSLADGAGKSGEKSNAGVLEPDSQNALAVHSIAGSEPVLTEGTSKKADSKKRKTVKLDFAKMHVRDGGLLLKSCEKFTKLVVRNGAASEMAIAGSISSPCREDAKIRIGRQFERFSLRPQETASIVIKRRDVGREFHNGKLVLKCSIPFVDDNGEVLQGEQRVATYRIPLYIEAVRFQEVHRQ